MASEKTIEGAMSKDSYPASVDNGACKPGDPFSGHGESMPAESPIGNKGPTVSIKKTK